MAARQLKSAQEFATLEKIPKAYGSYEELAKDPNVQVVYIGTINSAHFPTAKLMLEHGKHVLCEKPFTLNLKCELNIITKDDIFGNKKSIISGVLSGTFKPIFYRKFYIFEL